MPMPWALVAACCIGMFAATASGSTRAPFLLDIAQDLATTLPAIANLFGVTSVAWGTSAYLTGRASDQVGRRVFLVFAPIVLACALFAMAHAQTYWQLVILVTLGGLCCGAFTATSMAEVSLRVESHQRGRALGWVMSGQSLTLLIGVPLSAWLGAYVGWRGVHQGLAGLAVAAAVFLFFVTTVPALTTAAGGNASNGSAKPLREVLTGPITRLFGALILERVSFGLSAFYYPAFLRTVYELDIAAVVWPLFSFAVGNVIGTIAGGQLGDRFKYRRVAFGASLSVAGCFAAVWFMWTPDLVVTAALGVGFSFFNALSRPPLMSAMADVPAEVRGAIMGLNSSVASIGWLTAALVGGWLYTGIGFNSFGPIMLTMCIAASLVVLPDSRITRHH
jgi:MFS transporter, DHA1 family, inner membrane transport protein